MESQALPAPLVKSRRLSPFPLSLMLSPNITSFFAETADAAPSRKSRQICTRRGMGDMLMRAAGFLAQSQMDFPTFLAADAQCCCTCVL